MRRIEAREEKIKELQKSRPADNQEGVLIKFAEVIEINLTLYRENNP